MTCTIIFTFRRHLLSPQFRFKCYCSTVTVVVVVAAATTTTAAITAITTTTTTTTGPTTTTTSTLKLPAKGLSSVHQNVISYEGLSSARGSFA